MVVFHFCFCSLIDGENGETGDPGADPFARSTIKETQ